MVGLTDITPTERLEGISPLEGLEGIEVQPFIGVRNM
jgi:hypothetical protein